MSIVVVEGKSTKNAVGLGLDVNGMTITVKAGDFELWGTSRQLLADQAFVVTSRPEKTELTGYLARKRSDNLVVVIVDEVIHDGTDNAYVFDADPVYEFLYAVYEAVIPPNTNSLDGVTINHRKTTQRVDE